MRIVALTLGLAMTAAPVRVLAQQPDTVIVPDRTNRMIIGGILGGGLGMIAGGAAGLALEVALTQDCADWCGVGGLLLGGMLGETLGMGAGVHLGNARQGRYSAAVAGPVLVGAAGLLILASDAADRVPAFVFTLGIPAGQLWASIAGSKASARHRSSQSR